MISAEILTVWRDVREYFQDEIIVAKLDSYDATVKYLDFYNSMGYVEFAEVATWNIHLASFTFMAHYCFPIRQAFYSAMSRNPCASPSKR